MIAIAERLEHVADPGGSLRPRGDREGGPVMIRVRPGLAFSVQTESGYSVCLVTHRIPQYGFLIWVSRPLFDHLPTEADARAVDEWRWSTLYPVKIALDDGDAELIGMIEIPESLREFPVLRWGGPLTTGDWYEMVLVDDLPDKGERTDDAHLSIFKTEAIDTMRDQIASGWMPEDEW